MRLARIATFAALLVASPAFAQAPAKDENHSAHHPATEAAPARPSPAPSGMGGMMMMGSGQDAGGMTAGGMMKGDMHRMMAMKHGGQMAMPMRHTEGRIAFLKAELRITPAQESKWTAFADAVRAGTRGTDKMPAMMADKAKGSTAPAMLESYEQVLSGRLDAVRATRAAFLPLYESLTLEQRKIADELLASPMSVM